MTQPAPPNREAYWHPERRRENRARPPRYYVLAPGLGHEARTVARVRKIVAELAPAIRDDALVIDRRTGLYVDLDGRPLDPQPDRKESIR